MIVINAAVLHIIEWLFFNLPAPMKPLIIPTTDYGRPILMKSQTFGLGQTNWADKFWDIWGIFGQTTTEDPVSSGQHKINRQQHNSTLTITSRHRFMLFYAFKMAVAIAFLRGNSKS